MRPDSLVSCTKGPWPHTHRADEIGCPFDEMNRQGWRPWARKVPLWFVRLAVVVALPVYLGAGAFAGVREGWQEWRDDRSRLGGGEGAAR